MSSILFPTDFSASSAASLKVALNVAKAINKELIIFHAYEKVYERAIVDTKKLTQELAIVQQQLDAIGKEIEYSEQFKDVKFRTIIAQEEVLLAISEAIDKYNAEMVIMGSRGMSGLKKIAFGSKAIFAINQLKVPVLTVPTHFQLPIQKFIFATNYQPQDLTIIKQIAILADKLGQLNIHVCHVADQDNFLEQIKFKGFECLVKENINYQPLTFELKINQNRYEAIDESLQSNPNSILTLAIYKKNFIRRILEGNTTNHMAYQASAAILAFHAE